MLDIVTSTREDLLEQLREQLPKIHNFQDFDECKWENEGLALLKSRKYYKAKKIFKQLILFQPEYHGGYADLALVYKALGKKEEAIFLINEAINLAHISFKEGFLDKEVLEEMKERKEEIKTL